MHFKHVSAKIQLKNLKQHFDSNGTLGYVLGSNTTSRVCAASIHAIWT